MNKIVLILALICFAMGAIQWHPKINWQNAGLAFVTLSLII
jgi:membrane protein implicated in regulation of membrane protease activity